MGRIFYFERGIPSRPTILVGLSRLIALLTSSAEMRDVDKVSDSGNECRRRRRDAKSEAKHQQQFCVSKNLVVNCQSQETVNFHFKIS